MKSLLIKLVLLLSLIFLINNFLKYNHINEIPFDELNKYIISNCNIEGMSKADDLKIKELYNINIDEYEGCTVYIANDTMDVREIFLLKTNTNEQMENVKNSVIKRKEKQYSIFEGYGIEQIKLINDSFLYNEGKYILFIISPDSQYIGNIFYKKIKN